MGIMCLEWWYSDSMFEILIKNLSPTAAISEGGAFAVSHKRVSVNYTLQWQYSERSSYHYQLLSLILDQDYFQKHQQQQINYHRERWIGLDYQHDQNNIMKIFIIQVIIMIHWLLSPNYHWDQYRRYQYYPDHYDLHQYLAQIIIMIIRIFVILPGLSLE